MQSDKLSSLVDSILDKYGRLELMGQKVSIRVMKKISSSSKESLKTTVECPVSKLKCIRGNLTDYEIEMLLNQVDKGEMSFNELERKEYKKWRSSSDTWLINLHVNHEMI